MIINDEYIENRIKSLESSKDEFNELIKNMIEADDRNLFLTDMFCLGIINRSLLWVKGFTDLLKNKNFISSASLIRLHLDTLLQLYSVWLVAEPNNFVIKKMKWKQTNTMKDKKWNRLTDWYIKKEFFNDINNKDFLSLEKVYSETSWFIHFSDKHIFSPITSSEWWTFGMMLSDKMEHVPIDKECEAIEVMILITKWIMKYICWWIYTKEHPELTKGFKNFN